MAMTRARLAIVAALLLAGLSGMLLAPLRGHEPVASGLADAAPAAAEDDSSNPHTQPTAAVSRRDARDAQAMLPAVEHR